MHYFEMGFQEASPGLIPGFDVFEKRLKLEVLVFGKPQSRFKSIHSIIINNKLSVFGH